MITAATAHAADEPLRHFPDGAVSRPADIPVPLTATRFAVRLRDGIAMVETWRTFRNAEDGAIEVTVTLPMPIRAVLYAVDVETDGRVLKGLCQNRLKARETYESGGVDQGRLAVLHEEKLAGIHMISVVNIPPGAEITVRSAWAAFLTPASPGRVGLRIPLTVGDVYGRSPLLDYDDLLSGGPRTRGSLAIDGEDVQVRSGGRLVTDPDAIPLDRPLDLTTPWRAWPPLAARGHDGRRLSLTIAEDAARDVAIDAAVLIDRSGSMQQACSSARSGLSKYAAVRGGLIEAVGGLTGSDRLHLFAFNTSCIALGDASTPSACAAALAAAGPPEGGTEIGASLEAVLAATDARDIVLVTDGKSYALDVSRLVLSGRRFTVVLIGDDSLEAQVGQVASASDGALIVAHGTAVADSVKAAFATLRCAHRVEAAITPPVARLAVSRDGLLLDARWDEGDAPETPLAGAVRALATALVLPRMDDVAAADLAAAEGLVTRFSSLVLVDPQSPQQLGLPVSRKVSLPAPDTVAPAACAAPAAAAPSGRRAYAVWSEAREPDPALRATAESLACLDIPAFLRRAAEQPAAISQAIGQRLDVWSKLRPKRPQASSPAGSLAAAAPPDRPELRWPRLAAWMWNAPANDLLRGDLGALPAEVAAQLQACAAHERVTRTASALGLAPLLLVIGFLARRAGDPLADRVAVRIFAGLSAATVDAAIQALAQADRVSYPTGR